MRTNTKLHLLLSILVFLVVTIVILRSFQPKEPSAATDLDKQSYPTINRELPVLDKTFFIRQEQISVNEDQEVETTRDDISTPDLTDAFTETRTQYVNIDDLNMRSGPSINDSVVGVLALNQQVEKSQQVAAGAWVAIKFGEKIGYVNGTYLSDTVTEKKEPTSTPAEPTTTPVEKTATPEEKTPEKKVEQPDPPAIQNKAQALTTVANNQQLILVTNKQAANVSVKVETFERDQNGNWQPVLSTNGFIGKRGFSFSKKEGDGASPVGKFTIGTAFGSNGNPGTALNFRGITDDDVWVDDPESSLYNSWQSKQQSHDLYTSAENMNIPLYRYGFVINYNTNRVPYKGSAIFFHIGNSYTLGCTAVSEADVIRIIRWLNPAKQPVIIQTPASNLSSF